MKISNINLVYFSATYTTRKVVRIIADEINSKVIEYDITQKEPESDILSGDEDLLIVGMPVYAGRIPAQAVNALKKFKGNDTPALIICVYGNREYDDALLELKDIVTENGFKVIAAGAFIAQHSIFPQVGAKRPDDKDIAFIKAFANKSKERLDSITDTECLPDIQVKGNKPYKVPGNIPLKPRGNRKCDACGTCAKVCSTQAIPADSPRKTDKDTCISCGRCIIVCPQKARHFGGILYKLASHKFTKAHITRKEGEIFLLS